MKKAYPKKFDKDYTDESEIVVFDTLKPIVNLNANVSLLNNNKQSLDRTEISKQIKKKTVKIIDPTDSDDESSQEYYSSNEQSF